MAWNTVASYTFEPDAQGWTFGTGCGRSTSVGLEGSASIYVTQTTSALQYAKSPAISLTGTWRVSYLHKPASSTGRNGFFYLREAGVNKTGVLFMDGGIIVVGSAGGVDVGSYVPGKVYEVIIEGTLSGITSVSIRNVTDGTSAEVHTDGWAFTASSLTEVAIQAYSPTGSAVSYFDSITVQSWVEVGGRPVVTDPLVVTVKPVGREEYALSTDGQPRFSSARFGGYEAATIPCLLDDEEHSTVLGATVRIHGVTGIVWQGIVTRRPRRGEPLLAQGWGWCGTLGRRKVLYAKTDFPGKLSEYRPASTYGSAFTANIENGTIKIAQSPGTSCSAGDWMAYYYWGDLPLDRLEFTANVAHPDVALRIYSSDAPMATSTLVYNKTATGSQTGQTADLGGKRGFLILCYVEVTPSTPSRMDKYVTMSSAVLYGTDVTPLTTANLVTDILENEIDVRYMPTVGGFIEAEPTVIEPLEFDATDANTKLREITKYAAYDFGWYMEGQQCLPHWTPTSTTPDYVIRIEDAESYDIDESSLDELVSAVVVKYEDANGTPTTATVMDTDPAHPLVQLGIVRYGEVEAQTASAATAADIGSLYLSERGRAQVKGSVTTRTVYTATGAPAYLPDIRCGRMALVAFPDGQRQCIIERVECVGDSIATITLDNAGYRLDIALAKLAKNE